MTSKRNYAVISRCGGGSAWRLALVWLLTAGMGGSLLLAAGAGPLVNLKASEVYALEIEEVPRLAEISALDWSATTNRLVVEKPGVNQFYDVYSVRPDGLMMVPLTANKDRNHRRVHYASPAWHPSGKFVVFAAQNIDTDGTYSKSVPGIGLNSNLWLSDAQGNKYWQLTHVESNHRNGKGVVWPSFSPDGRLVFWAGNTGNYPQGTIIGERALFLAEFHNSAGNCHLKKLKMLQPGEQKDYYASHGFSPDGRKIIFSGNLDKGQSMTGMDIYTLSLADAQLTNLTQTKLDWDEFGAYSPDGSKIAWASSVDLGITHPASLQSSTWRRFLRSEIWIMNADGSEKKRLTFFNTRGHDEYTTRRTYMGPCVWSPDGNQLAVIVHIESRTIETRLYYVHLGTKEQAELRQQRFQSKANAEAVVVVAEDDEPKARRPTPPQPPPQQATITW